METLLPASKRDISISMLRANLLTLLISIPIALAQLSLFVVLRGAIQVNGTMWGGMLFFAVLIVSVVAHELIHGLAWQVFARTSPAMVSYGFQWKTLTPYAHLSGPVEVNAYRIGGLMPGLLLGILPYLLSLALANVPLLVFSIIHTFAAGGDWLILWSLRKLPPGTRVEDHPYKSGVLCFGTRRKAEDVMRKIRPLKRANPPTIVLGSLIVIGAGLGMVVGLLLGNMLLGMIYGAGIGTVAGVVLETLRRRRVDGTPPPQTGQPARPVSLRWLLGCLAFLGVSAAFGGIVLTLNPTGTWLQIPLSILQFSPFRDFLIPGLILGIVFGLGSFATLLALWFRPAWSMGTALTRFTGAHWSWSAAVAIGLGQVIWIVTEMLMVRGTDWLQFVYGGLGLLIVLLSFQPGLRRYLTPSTAQVSGGRT
jgi:hypothetical protein